MFYFIWFLQSLFESSTVVLLMYICFECINLIVVYHSIKCPYKFFPLTNRIEMFIFYLHIFQAQMRI